VTTSPYQNKELVETRRPGRRGLPPGLAVAIELGRALCGIAIAPLRTAIYLAVRKQKEEAIRGDLATAAPVLPAPEDLRPLDAEALGGRPLRIFIAAAEHSGEIHAANLIDALRKTAMDAGLKEPEFVGLGGAALEERGMRSIGNPGERAAMGFDGVLSALPYYLAMLRDAAQNFRDERPDLMIPVDSPALHVPLAHLAQKYDVPVAHFVTPQYWGWAPWRVKGYRKAVNLGLSILPFEPSWYGRHGVNSKHVGHPLLDELQEIGAPLSGVAARTEELQDPAPCGPLILLPGSREGVVRRNLPWMLDRIAELQSTPEFKDLEVVLPHSRRDLDEVIEQEFARSVARVRLAKSGLHKELARGACAFAVSGTVVLDILPHRLPTVVLYRLKNNRGIWLRDHLFSVPWFTSVNLLANREVHPEFAFTDHGDKDKGEGEAMRVKVRSALERALGDGDWRRENLAGQNHAESRLGPPGAVTRGAHAALEMLAQTRKTAVLGSKGSNS